MEGLSHRLRTIRGCWAVLAALVVVVAAIAASGVAVADSPIPTKLTVSTSPNPEVSMGDPIRLQATLHTEDGQPVSKAAVAFYTSVTFIADTSGLVEIGDAVTNDQGVAVFEYESRQEGENAVRARYSGDGRYAPSYGDAKFAVEGVHQFYEPEAGIRVRFVSKWMLVGLMGMLWGIYLFVGIKVLLIALSPPDREILRRL